MEVEGGRLHHYQSPSPFFFPLAAGCPFPRTLPRMQNAKYSLPLFKIAIPPQLKPVLKQSSKLIWHKGISMLKCVPP